MNEYRSHTNDSLQSLLISFEVQPDFIPSLMLRHHGYDQNENKPGSEQMDEGICTIRQMLKDEDAQDFNFDPRPIDSNNIKIVSSVPLRESLCFAFEQGRQNLELVRRVLTQLPTECCAENATLAGRVGYTSPAQPGFKRQGVPVSVAPISTVVEQRQKRRISNVDCRDVYLPMSISQNKKRTENLNSNGRDHGDVFAGKLFRHHQSEQWNEKYEALRRYHHTHGHCNIPPNYGNDGKTLYRWLKRQRYHFKLKRDGKKSPMSKERVAALEKLQISWDPQISQWRERLTELTNFLNVTGHCNVPSKYPPNPRLSTWVKCQRRQFKLYKRGKKSNLTTCRIEKLLQLGFVFEPRPKSK